MTKNSVTTPRKTRRRGAEKGAETRRNTGPKIHLTALTDRQQTYINALTASDLVFTLGCAGTGKTYVAASVAAKAYSEKKIRQIIVTRPNITGSKSLGYFPGTLEEKMSPWMQPIIDVLIGHLGKGKVDLMIKDETLKFEPFETMRGRSFEDAFVLLDEAQNVTYEELKMFLTRIGQGSTVVVNGDVAQCDLKNKSGLRTIVSIIESQNLDFPVIEFTERDIVRSDICATWIRAFNEHEKGDR